jgi:DNA transposition AAA+ family ATPase
MKKQETENGERLVRSLAPPRDQGEPAAHGGMQHHVASIRANSRNSRQGLTPAQYGFLKEVAGQVKGQPGLIRLYGCDEVFRDKFLQWRAENPNWSDAAIGAQIGRSKTMLYHYLHPAGNVYSGDSLALEKKLAEFLRDYRLEMDTNVASVDCEVARQIEDAMEEIRTAKRIGVILGAPGFGKSRGINLYCRSHELAVAFRVCCWQKSQADFAECLFKAAGIESARRGLLNMRPLVEKMTGTARPFLVDDAHKLTRAALQLAYDFRDATGAPVGLFGDERLIGKLRDDGQRLRRTGIVFRLKLKDPGPLIEHHVDTLAPDAGEERADLVKLCRTIVLAENGGHFGSLQVELSLAARLKKGNHDWDWCEAVRRAHQKLIRDYSL